MDAEGKADRAANEIVDLVEQKVQHSTSQIKGTRLSPDIHNSAHPIATDTVERMEHTVQDDAELPEWVIAESRAMSREVTPPDQFFFRDQGERKGRDCGPVAVISTLYYICCKTGIKRAELEALLAYHEICQFAATHLQQQTILEVAQVDATQMEGCQKEVHRAT
jgi:hypothetical protein